MDAVIVADLGAFRLAGMPPRWSATSLPRPASPTRSPPGPGTSWGQAGHPGPGAQPGGGGRDPPGDPPGLEIEAFVHGAMCVSYSGPLPALQLHDRPGRQPGSLRPALPLSVRPDGGEAPREYFPVFEDEKGTYIMNSRDMCMIDHVGELMDAGLDSLKIEGPGQVAYYAAIVTGPTATPSTPPGRSAPGPRLAGRGGQGVSHRHYSTGFFYGQPGQFNEDARYIRDWQVCAIVEELSTAAAWPLLSPAQHSPPGRPGGAGGAEYRALLLPWPR